MTKFSIKCLFVAVALFAIGFAFLPGLSILVLSFVPFLICVIFLLRTGTSASVKTVAGVALLISIFPIYVTSIGPMVWLDSRLDQELNYHHVYAPLEPIAEATGMISPLASYTRLWVNPEPQTLPSEAFVQIQANAARQ